MEHAGNVTIKVRVYILCRYYTHRLLSVMLIVLIAKDTKDHLHIKSVIVLFKLNVLDDGFVRDMQDRGPCGPGLGTFALTHTVYHIHKSFYLGPWNNVML
ncbi:hypothetical protein ILYODFUR_020221 [Ilyodon furcidens]|uniref:Uncharacterized protein n=1 Tax=Ilyodon furcidens TaxID=33524 RepID=A0ABV0SYN6_9TELE